MTHEIAAAPAVVSTTGSPVPRWRSVCLFFLNQWFLLGLILMLGFGLRAWYLSEIQRAPDFAAPQQEADIQDYHARAMLTGDWTVRPGENDPEIRTTPYFRAPGYPYCLSAVYFFTDGSYLAPRILNMFLGLASIVLLFLLTRSIFGSGPGLMAALLASCYWGFIYWEGELNDSALLVFFGLCLMHALRLWCRKTTFPRAFLAGLIMGACALMQPNILLFGLLVAAWMGWVERRKKTTPRKIPVWAGLALACMLVIAPVTLRNYAVSGEVVPISTSSGEDFLIGSGEDSDGITPWTPYLQQLEGTGRWSVWVHNNVVRGLGKELEKPDLGHAAASTLFYHKALDFASANKTRTLGLALKKAALFLSPLEISCDKVVQEEKGFYAPLKYLPGFPLVLALFIAGCCLLAHGLARRTLRDFPAGSLEFAVLIVGFNLVHFLSLLPFIVNGRARVPVIPFMLVVGAYAVYALWRALLGRAFLKAAVGAAAIILLYSVCCIQFLPYAPDLARWHYQRADSLLRTNHLQEGIKDSRDLIDLGTGMVYMHQRLGESLAQHGAFDDAAAVYEAGLKLSPDFQDLHYLLASALAKLRRSQESMQQYQEALRLDPDDARAHRGLGILLAESGRTEEAIAQYDEALRVRPHFADVLERLGRLLRAQGRGQDVIARHEAIVKAHPGDAESYYYFGRELQIQGWFPQALENYEKAVELEPRNASARSAVAATLVGQGKIEEAIAKYEESIRLEPNDKQAHTGLAVLLSNQGQVEEAVRHIREALRIDPGYGDALEQLPRLLEKLGNPGQAVEQYQATLRMEPNNQDAHFLLGCTLAKQDKKDEAFAEFGEALRLNPDDARARNELGDLLVELKRPDEALKQYGEALRVDSNFAYVLNKMGKIKDGQEKYEEGMVFYRQALALNRENQDAHYLIACDLVKVGKKDQAFAEFGEALRLNPDDARAHNELGDLLMEQERPEEALKHYEEALRADPNFVFVLIKMGRIMDSRDKRAEAVSFYLRALALDKDNQDVHYLAAGDLVRLDRGEEAAAHFEEALRLNPKDARAHNEYGMLLRGMKKMDDAVKHFELAVQAKPDFALALNNWGNALLEGGGAAEAARQQPAIGLWGGVLPDNSRFDEAEDKFRRALKVRPNDEYAYINLAKSAEQQQHFDDAAELYQKAMKNCPANSMIPNDLGLMHFNRGNYDEAVKWYNAALQVDPKNPKIYNNLGYNAYVNHRLDEAVAFYKQALDLMPRYVLALTNLGTALADQGKMDEAITAYETAVAIRPNADLLNSLGNQYLRKGEHAKAQGAFEKALQMNPDHAAAQEGLKNAVAAQK